MTIKDKHTEKSFFEAVSSLDLNNHIAVHNTWKEDGQGVSETKAIERFLLPVLDRPWPAEIPPWRIVVLPLAPGSPKTTRCFIAFAFSHALGDGMSGLAFHRSFLNAWNNQPTINPNTAEKPSFIVKSPTQSLPPPFDTPSRLPISWSYLLAPLLAACLPKFLNDLLGLRASTSTLTPGTWTGPPMFFDADNRESSRLHLLEIEEPLVTNALAVSRAHGSKLTATMHQMIVRALSRAIPNGEGRITDFVSGTAIDMRGSIGVPGYTWGLYVNGDHGVHPRVQFDGDKQDTFSHETWEEASLMTKSLAESATRLQDQAIGLLRYAPSIRGWTAKKMGERRDCSYRVSNLLAFDGSSEKGAWISKVIFATPADATGSPLAFDIVSLKGGSLVCSVGWQAGALGVPVEEESKLVEEICSSIRADFEGLRV